MKDQSISQVLVLLNPYDASAGSQREWVSNCSTYQVDASNNLCCYNTSGDTVAMFAAGSWMGVKSSNSSTL